MTYRFATGPRKGQKAFVLKSVPDADADHNASSGLVVKNSGFSLHAGVATKASERDKLERIARYIARQAVSEERLSTNAAGDVIYRFKKPWDDGTAALKMTPLEFMERLAALVPRPRVHLTRYSGVLAPHYKYRRDIVPKPKAVLQLATEHGEQDDPEDSDVPPPRKQRMHWARLLKRVFAIDVETCPTCQGRVRIIAAIEEPRVIKKILEHLGLPTCPPRIHPARGPPTTRLGARSLTSSPCARARQPITNSTSHSHFWTDGFSPNGRALPIALQLHRETQKMDLLLA